MEEYTLAVSGNASSSLLNSSQNSPFQLENQYEISQVAGSFEKILPAILPGKKYRVVGGRLLAVEPGSPPTPSP